MHNETTGRRSDPETARRQAVARRDARFDGAFVFGVRSTHIYCRPSCPARRPRPERILFFDAPEAAERAGFRPCRRCHPRNGTNPLGKAAQHIARLCREIDRATSIESAGPLTLARLAQAAGMSPSRIERLFRKTLGVTPRQYADARRLRAVKTRLRSGSSVTEALYDAGYGSPSRLYERAPAQLGMTPLAYRRGGARADLRYCVAPCPLGKMLVAATGRGIAALYLGDSSERLRSLLKGEFPRAAIREDRRGLGRWVRAIVAHLQGTLPKLDLPLDVRATAFERRVWQELVRIPYGATRSYAEIARAIGRPSAARAVARACARNPAAVVIPCHRVVRGDGQLSGYRWGRNRKRALLDRERKEREQAAGHRV